MKFSGGYWSTTVIPEVRALNFLLVILQLPVYFPASFPRKERTVYRGKADRIETTYRLY
jgi:hypothetical protein